jgi:uncharacterized protein YegJ (DUF2314 family)
MKKTYAYAVLASILMLLVAPGCEKKGEGVIKREGEPDYVQDFDDARMDSAIAEAKATIVVFISALEKQEPSTKGFALKKAYTYAGDKKEFIWISNVRLKEGAFEGEINNEPVNKIGVKLGQKVRVTKDEIEDWMFMSNGRLQGGYTIVALVYGTEEEEEYQRNLGIDWKKYGFLKIK